MAQSITLSVADQQHHRYLSSNRSLLARSTSILDLLFMTTTVHSVVNPGKHNNIIASILVGLQRADVKTF